MRLVLDSMVLRRWARAGRPLGLLGLVVATLAGRPAPAESPFAVEVRAFDPGSGGVPGYDLPESALGMPTRTTGGSFLTEAVTMFQPAWLPEEIVSLGVGGSIELAFDHEVRDDPGNPFGIDLLIFGNAFCTDLNYPAGICGGLYEEGGRIDVSLDGVDWRTVPSVVADGAFPTLGWSDSIPYATDAGRIATDFTRPVDPDLGGGSIVDLSYQDLLSGYDGAGGGAGIDLAWVGLPAIRYVRIVNDGANSTPEIDAIADVAPDAPSPDVNDDGRVDGADMGLLLALWGTDDPDMDLDGSGDVGGGDLGILLAAWSE